MQYPDKLLLQLNNIIFYGSYGTSAAVVMYIYSKIYIQQIMDLMRKFLVVFQRHSLVHIIEIDS